MNLKKVFIGGIVGTVAYFLLGWLAYGNLMADFMKKHPGLTVGFERPMPHLMLYLVIGHVLLGFLLAYIFAKSNVNSFGSGFVTAGIIGGMFSAAMDSIMYATTTLFSRTGVLADVITFTVISAITGGLVGMAMGMGKKAT